MSDDGLSPDEIEERLSPLGPVWLRPMFGGHGVFLDAVMFGLVADGALYLKVDDANRRQFEDAGLDPFVYTAKGRPVAMSYHRAPGSPAWEVIGPFAEGSLAAARRAAAARSRR